MGPRIFAVGFLVVSLVGCGDPSAVEMRDRLGAMSQEQAQAESRQVLIERIGLEPHEIETGISDDCEIWVYDLSGGEVRLNVCHLDGVFYAQVREFGE